MVTKSLRRWCNRFFKYVYQFLWNGLNFSKDVYCSDEMIEKRGLEGVIRPSTSKSGDFFDSSS